MFRYFKLKITMLFIFNLSSNTDCQPLSESRSWNVDELGSTPRGKDITMAELLSRNAITMRRDSCLSHTNESLHSVNEWIDEKHVKPISGTTFWINEFLAPGHMYHDIQLLQLLQITRIDQIILQRAPCARADFCEGIGYWGSFFEGLYTLMVDSSNHTKIPLYIRFSPNDTLWTPHMIGSRPGKSVTDLVLKSIPLSEKLCFENVIRQACNRCFHNTIASDTAKRFKQAANAMLSKNHLIPLSSSPRNMIVTIAHRGSFKRHLANREDLASTLRSKLPPSVTVRMFDTTNQTLATHLNQVKIAAESDVIIATHGAYIGNVIYMREGALVVELIGEYRNRLEAASLKQESANYKILATNFLVFHRHVPVRNLKRHSQNCYYMQKSEISKVSEIVLHYLQNSSPSVPI